MLVRNHSRKPYDAAYNENLVNVKAANKFYSNFKSLLIFIIMALGKEVAVCTTGTLFYRYYKRKLADRTKKKLGDV